MELLDGLARPARRGKIAEPAVEAERAAQGGVAAPADPDRRAAFPQRRRGRDLAHPPELTVEIDGLAGPQRLEDLQVFVHAPAAGLAVDPQRGPFPLDLAADAGAEDETP